MPDAPSPDPRRVELATDLLLVVQKYARLRPKLKKADVMRAILVAFETVRDITDWD